MLVYVGSHVEEEGSGVLLAGAAPKVVVEVTLVAVVGEVALVAAVPLAAVGGAAHGVAIEYAVQFLPCIGGEGFDETIPAGEEVALA